MSDEEREMKELEEELNNSAPAFPDIPDSDVNDLEKAIDEFETEEGKKLISSASDFDELFAILRRIGEVSGKSKTYSSNDLITIINNVRNHDFPLNTVTRGLGLRAKVEELIK